MGEEKKRTAREIIENYDGQMCIRDRVYDGEEAFSGAGEMHLHGTDSDGSDCETDQAERA